MLALSGCLPENAGFPDSRSSIPRLELVRALPVETTGYLEPSGLTRVDGRLFTVADKVDNIIYRVETGPESARMVPHLEFIPPEAGTMDWEGITHDPGGSFYLISERRGRLLRVTLDGTATWATPDLRVKARELGLFKKRNAGFEGVTWLGPNHWLGAAEREPRGLVEFKGTAEGVRSEAWDQTFSPFNEALPILRVPDYSGLCMDGGFVYGLFRNAHLVVRLEKQDGEWRETAAWSYRHIETDPRWAYKSQTYGQAEGLVVDGDTVTIIFDNNIGARQADPRDRRPLLVLARFPE